MNRIQEDHIKLPQNHHLSISSLAGIFGNTTATYKFYWFVALMDKLSNPLIIEARLPSLF